VRNWQRRRSMLIHNPRSRSYVVDRFPSIRQEFAIQCIFVCNLRLALQDGLLSESLGDEPLSRRASAIGGSRLDCLSLLSRQLTHQLLGCCLNHCVGNPLGSVAKIAERRNGPGAAVLMDQTVVRPRVSLMNRTSPTTSLFGNQLTWPFRIMCTTS
jgi:hypothetical protein